MRTDQPVQGVPAPERAWMDVLRILAIALLYFVAARLSLLLIFDPEGIAAIWPPSGIFLSSILLTRRSVRPYLVGALFITDFIAEMLAGTPWVVSLVYAATLTVDGALSAWLLLRYVGEPITFNKTRDVIGFLLLSILLSNALSSVIAALAAKLYLGVAFWTSWLWWWSSDVVGNLLLTPLIISAAFSVKTRFREFNKSQAIEYGILLFGMIVLDHYAFSHFREARWFGLLLNLFAFPFLIWASLRFGMLGVAAVSLVLAVQIIWHAIRGDFLFLSSESVLATVILVQIYIAIASIPSMFLATLFTDRKRAEEEAQRRAAKLALLNHIGRQLVELMNIDAIFRRAVQLIQETFGYEHVGLYEVKQEAQALVLRAEAGADTLAFKLSRLPFGTGTADLAALDGQTVLTNNFTAKGQLANPFRDANVRAALTVPIRLGDSVEYVLDVQSCKPGVFGYLDILVFETLAGQLATVLNNARLYENERRERALAQTFQRITQDINTFSDIGEALNLVTNLLAELVQFDGMMMLLIDEDSLNIVVQRGFPEGNQPGRKYRYANIALLQDSIIKGQPLIVQAGGNLQAEWLDLPAFTETTTAWIGIPLLTGGIVIGYLCLSTERLRGYDDEDIKTVQAFAHQAVLAIYHSQLMNRLQQTQIHLTRVARLSAAGEVAAGVAHQINNPLTTIIAQTHLLLKRLEPDTRDYNSVRSIKEAAYRAGLVVQRMLDFSRIASYDRTYLDVNAGLLEAVDLVRVQIEPQFAQIILDLAPNLPKVLGIREYLEDVWINLLLNARDALSGSENGIIIVNSQLIQQGNAIEVTIQDNGPGIASENLPHIFNPFFTTKPKGTGLGLSICHDVILNHSGTIYATGKEGEGASFHVVLPAIRREDP